MNMKGKEGRHNLLGEVTMRTVIRSIPGNLHERRKNEELQSNGPIASIGTEDCSIEAKDLEDKVFRVAQNHLRLKIAAVFSLS